MREPWTPLEDPRCFVNPTYVDLDPHFNEVFAKLPIVAHFQSQTIPVDICTPGETNSQMKSSAMLTISLRGANNGF